MTEMKEMKRLAKTIHLGVNKFKNLNEMNDLVGKFTHEGRV